MGYFVIKGDGHQSIDRIDIPPRWGFPTSGTPDIHWPKCPKQMQGRRNVLVEQNMDFYLYIYMCVCVNLCLPIPRMQIYGYLFLDCCSWHQSSFVWGLSGCNSSLWWFHRAHHAVATRARGTLWVWQIETGGHKLKDMCHFGEFMVFLAVFVVSGVKLPWMVCSHFYELQSASRVRCLAHFGTMARWLCIFWDTHLYTYRYVYMYNIVCVYIYIYG